MDAQTHTLASPWPGEPHAPENATLSEPMTEPVRTTTPQTVMDRATCRPLRRDRVVPLRVHCAALPLVIAVLPAIGLGFLANHKFERGFVAFASVLALSTLFFGFRRHRQFRAFWFLVPGILLLAAGMIVDFDQSATLHAVLVAMGGTLVAASHVTNLRLAHVHVHSAACEH